MYRLIVCAQGAKYTRSDVSTGYILSPPVILAYHRMIGECVECSLWATLGGDMYVSYLSGNGTQPAPVPCMSIL